MRSASFPRGMNASSRQCLPFNVKPENPMHSKCTPQSTLPLADSLYFFKTHIFSMARVQGTLEWRNCIGLEKSYRTTFKFCGFISIKLTCLPQPGVPLAEVLVVVKILPQHATMQMDPLKSHFASSVCRSLVVIYSLTL